MTELKMKRFLLKMYFDVACDLISHDWKKTNKRAFELKLECC